MSITEKSTLLENWDLIDRIELVGNHVFFVGKLGVTIIPRLAVTEGNFDEFVAEARRLHADATGTNTPVPLPAR